MAETARVPPELRPCRGCRQFVKVAPGPCPFCGGDVDALDEAYQARQAELAAAAEAPLAASHAAGPRS